MPALDPPESPPLLVRMGARKAALEARREEDFARWRAAIEEHRGNVTRAARALLVGAKDVAGIGKYMVRRLGLVGYARDLRERATGRGGPGRPAKDVPAQAKDMSARKKVKEKR